jgi:hypothetical protein
MLRQQAQHRSGQGLRWPRAHVPRFILESIREFVRRYITGDVGGNRLSDL